MSLLFLNINNPVFSLSKNFTSKEVIDASTPEENAQIVFVDERVIAVAQYIRDKTKSPITISSAYRNAKYNATLKNSSKVSQHIEGKAWDIKGKGVFDFVKTAYETGNDHGKKLYDLGLRGIGFYDWGIHIDVRDGEDVKTWNFQEKKK